MPPRGPIEPLPPPPPPVSFFLSIWVLMTLMYSVSRRPISSLRSVDSFRRPLSR
jgi:hypothetical protein